MPLNHNPNENSPSPEQQFWSWFLSNQQRIEAFIDSDHSDYSVYEELTDQMNACYEEIVPELTKTEDDQYVLIITPDGIKAGIEPAMALYNAKPELHNWVVEKFRQPCDTITLNLDGLSYSADNLEIMPELDREEEVVNIHVFVRNMNTDPDKYQNLAFLYLDHILGEYNSLTKMGWIEFHHLDDGKSVEGSLSLLQLRELIVRELY